MTTLDRAALFLISNGYLISDANYVGTNASDVYSTMRRYTDVSAVVSGWSVDIDLNIRLLGSAFTIGGGNADFCVSSSGSVVIEVSAFASNCSTAGLVAGLVKLDNNRFCVFSLTPRRISDHDIDITAINSYTWAKFSRAVCHKS